MFFLIPFCYVPFNVYKYIIYTIYNNINYNKRTDFYT